MISRHSIWVFNSLTAGVGIAVKGFAAINMIAMQDFRKKWISEFLKNPIIETFIKPLDLKTHKIIARELLY